ncbi:hypothetical protein AC628_12635 [Bradyrhizobium sp. NAS96.2]|nr:hypothetical protein AC628_12635 [Bradyrhizobium sp. NAS96.2]
MVPLKRPVKTAFGVIDSGPLVLIDVETDQGVTGRTYIFAYSKLILHPLCYLIEETGLELAAVGVAASRCALTSANRWLDRTGSNSSISPARSWQGLPRSSTVR